MLQLTEDQFYDQYPRIQNHIDDNAGFSGCMFETYDEELDYVISMIPEKRVVTILEGDDNTIYYASGYHLVNRIGYFVLENPITEDFEVEIDITPDF